MNCPLDISTFLHNIQRQFIKQNMTLKNRIAKRNINVSYSLVCEKVLLFLSNGAQRGHFIEANVHRFIDAGSREMDLF